MTKFLRLSSWMYGRLLFLHSEDLRRDFGAEMALVFAEDLTGAWRDRRVAGVILVWLCALGEVVRIGLPGQRTNHDIVIPVVSFILNAGMRSVELMFALWHVSAPGVHGPPLNEAIMIVVLWPSVAAALISFAVVRVTKLNSTTSLQLFSPYRGGEEDPRDR